MTSNTSRYKPTEDVFGLNISNSHTKFENNIRDCIAHQLLLCITISHPNKQPAFIGEEDILDPSNAFSSYVKGNGSLLRCSVGNCAAWHFTSADIDICFGIQIKPKNMKVKQIIDEAINIYWEMWRRKKRRRTRRNRQRNSKRREYADELDVLCCQPQIIHDALTQFKNAQCSWYSDKNHGIYCVFRIRQSNEKYQFKVEAYVKCYRFNAYALLEDDDNENEIESAADDIVSTASYNEYMYPRSVAISDEDEPNTIDDTTDQNDQISQMQVTINQQFDELVQLLNVNRDKMLKDLHDTTADEMIVQFDESKMQKIRELFSTELCDIIIQDTSHTNMLVPPGFENTLNTNDIEDKICCVDEENDNPRVTVLKHHCNQISKRIDELNEQEISIHPAITTHCTNIQEQLNEFLKDWQKRKQQQVSYQINNLKGFQQTIHDLMKTYSKQQKVYQILSNECKHNMTDLDKEIENVINEQKILITSMDCYEDDVKKPMNNLRDKINSEILYCENNDCNDIDEVNENQYVRIHSVLQKVDCQGWRKRLKTFKQHKVSDELIPQLTEENWKELIDEIGIRIQIKNEFLLH